MRTRTIPAALAAISLLQAGAALAQQAPPPATQGATPPAAGARPGPGPRPGGAMGPRFGRDYTPGWSMMTPQERDAHRERMHSARNAEECRQALDEHRKLMQERAKERGIASMPGPRRDACANWPG